MSFYDNDNMDIKTMAERCREYYNPEDFVIIMNVDTEPFQYVIQRPENVMIHQPSNVTKELYYSKEPDVITLAVGQTRMVPAYEADHVIKQLSDRIIFRNRKQVIDETGGNPKESTNDPQTQHKYVKLIFQGKRDFLSDYNRQLNDQQPAQTTQDIERDLLGDLDSKPGPGRPKKQVA